MSSAGDRIWDMVCGLPEPDRSNRPLCMLKAYIDDSGIKQPPLYSLAGWVGPPSMWRPFSDAWDEVLRMKPRIGYFKLEEAMNFKGEFNGISEEMRNEKLNLLVDVINTFKPLGVGTSLPHDIFQDFFVKRYANKDAHNPFIPLAFSVIWTTVNYLSSQRVVDKVEFVFDYQPGSNQMAKVQEIWEKMRETANPLQLRYAPVSPPQFLDDKDVIPLQAADLIAGWRRLVDLPSFGGKETFKPWTGISAAVFSIIQPWLPNYADQMSRILFGPPDFPG
jgi:hypothetical protein